MCHFSSYRGGAFLPSGTLYMCFYNMKVKNKASLLSAKTKLENILPSLPSPLAPLSSGRLRHIG